MNCATEKNEKLVRFFRSPSSSCIIYTNRSTLPHVFILILEKHQNKEKNHNRSGDLVIAMLQSSNLLMDPMQSLTEFEISIVKIVDVMGEFRSTMMR